MATSPRASTGKIETLDANRRVDRRAQLRLVVDAVQPQPAGKVDERLLLGERPQHADRRLQRRELAIGVEDAELGIVLSEGGADIVRRVGNAVAVQIVARHDSEDDLVQLRPIVGELLPDAHAAALERHDRDEVLRLHLRGDIAARGGKGAHQIARRQRRLIEVEDDQPPIPVARVEALRPRHGAAGAGDGSGAAAGRHSARGWLLFARTVHSLVLDERHCLRFAVLGHDEIIRREPFDRLAVAVFDCHCLDDQAGAAAESRLLRGAEGATHAEDAKDAEAQMRTTNDDTSRRLHSAPCVSFVRFTHQYLSLIVICSFRIWFARFGSPNCGLSDDRVHAGEGDVVEHVRGVEAPVEIQAVADEERSREAGVQVELRAGRPPNCGRRGPTRRPPGRCRPRGFR